MDVQQLRSWVFELVDPLTEDRTYILLSGRDGTLVDLPPFDRRAFLSLRGVCEPRLVFFTHADRARDVERWREAFPGLRTAIHEADAGAVPGGVDVRCADGDVLTRGPETHVVHIGAHTPGASMLLADVPGGVLFTGDAVLGDARGRLALPDASYADPKRVRAGIEKLRAYEFSAVLSTHGRPVWNAAKERYLELLNELPRPKRRFGHLVDAPWDRQYLRVRSQMAPNPLVPKEETIAPAAGHGPSTLVPAWEQRPAKEVAWRGASAVAQPVPADRGDGKPWSLAGETHRALPPRPPGPVQALPSDLVERSPVPFRHLTAAELAAIPEVDWHRRSLDLSLDGAEAVFSWDATGSFEIYRAPIAGDAIYQLTSAGASSVQPRISPDGRLIAFLRESDAGSEIWLVGRDGARERRLLGPAPTRTGLSWAPDGTLLAHLAQEGGSATLQVIDVTSGTSRVIARDLRTTHDPRSTEGAAWSRDGSRLAYASSDASGNADLYVVAPDGSAAPRRIDTRGGVAGISMHPVFGHDDRWLAFATDVRGRWEIAMVAVDGGPVQFIRDGHFDELDPLFDADPKRLLYFRDAEATVSVRRTYLVSLDDEPALDAPGVHFDVRVRADGGLVYQWSGAREPADVYVKGRGDILPRRITRSLPSGIEAGLFVEPRHIRYEAPDGTGIPALLYVPHPEAADGDVPPAVVYGHVGPTLQHFVVFDRWAQWFANRGYVVLAPNVRGSTGYGRAFREADRGDLGGKDLEDFAAGATWLAEQGIADAKRIGAFGERYGGYLALRAAQRWPERFAAACSIAGRVALDGLVARRPELGPADPSRSVIEDVDALRAPLLLLYGERDRAVPIAEVRRLVESMRSAGKAFSFHTYDAGHELIRRDDRRDAFERAIEFFDEHVAQRALVAARA